jgi:AcrR family transcriptional regulator
MTATLEHQHTPEEARPLAVPFSQSVPIPGLGEATRVRKRLADGRREELLDGVMGLIAARGFSDVRVRVIAGELHCSVATLYKIAPSKDSLVVLALRRWGERTLEDIEARATRTSDPAERARAYFRAGAQSLSPLSPAFRSDVDRYESTRLVWSSIADAFIDRFVALLDSAVEAGQIRPTNTRFLAHVLRQIALVARDESALAPSGLTAEQAVLEIDALIWEGIRRR